MNPDNRAATAAAALALFCLLAAGCAKTGEPQPPLLLIPRPASDLNAVQISNEIVISVSLPVENTAGGPVTTLDLIEVLRVLESERISAGPLPEEQFLARAGRVLSLSVGDSAAYTSNGRLTLRDDMAGMSGIHNSGFRYAVRFINRKNQTAGLSNQVFIAPVPMPAAPGPPAFEVAEDRIRVTWEDPQTNTDGSTPPTVAGYNLYRAETPDGSGAVPLNNSPLQKPEYEDRAFEFGKTYFYAVSVVGSRENPYAESRPSEPASVTPRDTFPPGAPVNLNAVVESGMVILLWSAPGAADVAGYRIYRRPEGGARALLEPELVNEFSYRDTKVEPGRRYTYSVHAVDTHGNEGPAAETSAN
jgi:hypothetical protein